MLLPDTQWYTGGRPQLFEAQTKWIAAHRGRRHIAYAIHLDEARNESADHDREVSMGADLIIVVFAVVVIGGMGSIMGSIVTGFTLGVVEGLTKVFYPEASNTVIFVIMAIVLLVKPTGLFGREK